jgi:hypothetical protein
MKAGNFQVETEFVNHVGKKATGLRKSKNIPFVTIANLLGNFRNFIRTATSARSVLR